MSQLGVVLTPYGNIPGSFPTGVSRTVRGATSWGQPFDPQFYTRGETGYFYDTQLGRARGLGDIPTDFDVASRYGYLPVRSGWTVTNQGYQAGSWQPPNGGYPGQPMAARSPVYPFSGRGLGDLPQPPATAEDVVAVMAAHNDRIFALTLVSTTAVAISALIGLIRTLKLIKDDRRD